MSHLNSPDICSDRFLHLCNECWPCSSPAAPPPLAVLITKCPSSFRALVLCVAHWLKFEFLYSVEQGQRHVALTAASSPRPVSCSLCVLLICALPCPSAWRLPHQSQQTKLRNLTGCEPNPRLLSWVFCLLSNTQICTEETGYCNYIGSLDSEKSQESRGSSLKTNLRTLP